MGKPVVLLAAVLAALAGPAGAREPDVPPSQVAFRAVLKTFYEKCETETEAARFAELQRARAAAFAQSLGEGLSFDGWLLELKGIEPTPRGGYFVRFIDPAMADLRAVRPTYWNGGPGKIGRETAILRDTELHDVLKAMRPGMQSIISGRFFPDEDGGPLFESARPLFAPTRPRRRSSGPRTFRYSSPGSSPSERSDGQHGRQSARGGESPGTPAAAQHRPPEAYRSVSRARVGHAGFRWIRYGDTGSPGYGGKHLRSRDLSRGGVHLAHIERPPSPDAPVAQLRPGSRQCRVQARQRRRPGRRCRTLSDQPGHELPLLHRR